MTESESINSFELKDKYLLFQDEKVKNAFSTKKGFIKNNKEFSYNSI